MRTELASLVFDAADPAALAGFWSSFVDWQAGEDALGRAAVRDPAGHLPLLVFEEAAGEKTVKNRIHLDLASSSPEAQRSIVDKALALGATEAGTGWGELPWVVLADPEGNEFCVLEPRGEYVGTGALAAVVLDAGPAAPAVFQELAEFWAAACAWPVQLRHPVQIGLRAPDGRGPWVEVLRAGDPKQVDDRVRLELVTDDLDRAEAELVARGATPGFTPAGVPWRGLRDPAGSDFRVLTG